MLYKDMSLHKVTEVYTEWFILCPNITLKFRTIAIFKASLNKMTIETKLVDTSMNFYCTKLCFYNNK
jgi:hypothetical protein